jgi:hypothetical protein
MQHPAELDDASLKAQCRVTHTRASGPGGQHRNKVQTAVVLHHQQTGLTAQASERRSQSENLHVALRRLRMELALHVRCERASPSAMWLGRTRGGRIALNVDHADFPVMLAEALDVIARHNHELSPAAAALGVSGSQLLKLLKDEPRALALLNTERQRRGLHPMK